MSFVSDLEAEARASLENQVRDMTINCMQDRLNSMRQSVDDTRANLESKQAELDAAQAEFDAYTAVPDQPAEEVQG